MIAEQTDRFLEAGITALLATLHDKCPGGVVEVLCFPDMCRLLTWSRSPVLPEGRTLIVGGRRQIAALSGIFNPRRVLLLDSQTSLVEARTQLQGWLKYDTGRAVVACQINQVALTGCEMEMAWQLLQGYAPEMQDSKRVSRIKLRLMDKIGAGSRVALLIRLRLLFRLDRHSLARVPVYGGDRRYTHTLMAWMQVVNRQPPG